jgi:hypothetical protein
VKEPSGAKEGCFVLLAWNSLLAGWLKLLLGPEGHLNAVVTFSTISYAC